MIAHKQNYAKSAMNNHDEACRQARGIILDPTGLPISPVNAWGNPWSQGAIFSAQDARSIAVYREAMNYLDSVIGEDNDTATTNAYNHALGKFTSIEHAESMMEKLQLAALNGSQAALIAYAAGSIYINKYAFVDFSWHSANELDFSVEGMEASADTPTLAPASPVVAHDTQALELIDDKGRRLTPSATGWQAESKSQPGTFHQISLSGGSCTCKGFGRHRKCWHTSLVRSLTPQLESEAKKRRQEAEKRRKEREKALPVMRPRRRGKSRMWK